MTTPIQAPCLKCGYNGPGFYQPETHECAAAQVGEPSKDELWWCNNVAIPATIERCAQWLEEDGNRATAKAMRKALLPQSEGRRKLKDKP